MFNQELTQLRTKQKLGKILEVTMKLLVEKLKAQLYNIMLIELLNPNVQVQILV